MRARVCTCHTRVHVCACVRACARLLSSDCTALRIPPAHSLTPARRPVGPHALPSRAAPMRSPLNCSVVHSNRKTKQKPQVTPDFCESIRIAYSSTRTHTRQRKRAGAQACRRALDDFVVLAQLHHRDLILDRGQVGLLARRHRLDRYLLAIVHLAPVHSAARPLAYFPQVLHCVPARSHSHGTGPVCNSSSAQASREFLSHSAARTLFPAATAGRARAPLRARAHAKTCARACPCVRATAPKRLYCADLVARFRVDICVHRRGTLHHQAVLGLVRLVLGRRQSMPICNADIPVAAIQSQGF